MPHQCTTCGCKFPDGSKQMLSGCPDCGGNKFQFLPAKEFEPSASETADTEDSAQASARRAIVSEDELPVFTRDESPEPLEPTDEIGGVSDPVEDNDDATQQPDLEELRQELNAQFESIKILRPGQYELNLMELYDRDEYIIALEEDGRYVIDVPNMGENTR